MLVRYRVPIACALTVLLLVTASALEAVLGSN